MLVGAREPLRMLTQALHCRHSPLSLEIMEALLWLKRTRNLPFAFITLSMLGCGRTACADLAQALQAPNSCLEGLAVADNPLGHKGARRLLAQVSAGRLQHLDIRCGALTSAGTHFLYLGVRMPDHCWRKSVLAALITLTWLGALLISVVLQSGHSSFFSQSMCSELWAFLSNGSHAAGAAASWSPAFLHKKTAPCQRYTARHLDRNKLLRQRSLTGWP